MLGSRQKRETQDDHGGRLGLFAKYRLQEIPRDRRCLRGLSLCRYRPSGGAHRQETFGRSSSPLPCGPLHKPLRGPRGGLILMGKDFETPFGAVAPKSGRKKKMSELLDSMVIPGIQGGPLMHIIAAKSVAFREALAPS